MKISNFVLIQLILIVTLFLGVLITYEQNDKESIIGFYSIINLMLYLYLIHKQKAEYISIYSFFIMFMYLFNLGLPISRFIGTIGCEESFFMERRIYSMGKDLFINYLLYSYSLISFIEIGIFYFLATFKGFPKYKDTKFQVYDVKHYRHIAFFCILLGLIPFILIEKESIINTLTFGYQSSDIVDSISGTGLGLISNFFYIGFFTLLLSYQKEKKNFIILCSIFSLYQIIRMYLTGDRSTGLTMILVILLMYHTYISKIKGKKMIMGIIVTYFFLAFLKLIEITRKETVDIEDIFTKILHENPFTQTIFEYGGNVWSGMMVYYSMTETYFRMGSTYIASIIGKPLSILHINDDIWNYADFSNYIISSKNATIMEVRSAMGGSFSGEVFFNFGYFGILLMPLFGYYLAKFSIACTNTRHNILYSGYFLYLSTIVTWWVRQYFPILAWHAIFYGISIFLIYRLLYKRHIYKHK